MIFIVVKDAPTANLLKYELKAQRFPDVHIFPSAAECFYFVSKGNIPDYIITDMKGNPENGISILRSDLFNSRTKILFLLSGEEENEASRMMEEGATDFVLKSAHSGHWMKELIRNICFLQKQDAVS